MANIPIVVVAYNRLESLKRICASLLRAEYPQGAELIVSIDRGDNLDVLEYADSLQWLFGEKRVIYQKENLGLKRHILTCGDLTQGYDGIILLEDDLVVSPDFYRFAQECYDFVKGKNRIAGVGLYNHRFSQLTEKIFEPLEDGFDNWYFRYACSWGQLWLKEAWQSFRAWYHENENYDFASSEKIPEDIKDWGSHSWLKFHIAYCVETDRYFLYPRAARTTCFSDAGVNFSHRENTFQVPLMAGGRVGALRLSELENSKAVYDQWMENKYLESCLEEEACIDLYNSKTWFEGKPYLLTTGTLENARLVRSYGREMRPQEWNVLYDVSGEEIRLYALTEDSKKCPRTAAQRAADAEYYIRGISYPYKKTIRKMFWQESMRKVKRKLGIGK